MKTNDIKKQEEKNVDLKQLESKVNELEQMLKDTVATVDHVEDEKLVVENQLKKALADYANLQRDMEKRMEIVMSQLKAKTALEVINVIDDVNYALQAKENIEMTDQVKSWIDGLVATLMNLKKSLDALGVKAMECKKGDQFDSSRHMVISTVPMGENDTLVDVVQDGYVLEGTGLIVRPARVVVGRSKS